MQQVPSTHVRHPMWPIYLCVAVTALGIGIINPLIPHLLEQNGANEFIVGLSTSVMFASLVLTGMPIGRTIDKFGIRLFLIVGLISYTVAMLAMPWTHSIPLFFMWRIFEGIGWSCVWTAAETYVSRVSSPAQRGHNTAVYGMSLASGTAAGPIIGTAVYEWTKNPVHPFLVAVAAAIIATVIVVLVVPEPHVHHTEQESGGVSFKITRPLILPLAIAFLYGYGTLSLVSLLPTLNYSNWELGTLISVTVIANIVAQVPIGRMLDRYGYRPLLIGSLSLLSAAALFSTLHPPFLLTLFLGMLLGAFAGTLYPIGLAVLAARVPPAKLGGASGMFTVCYGLGSFVGPALTGGVMSMVGAKHSDQALFGTIGCLVLALLGLMMTGIDRVNVKEEHPVSVASSGIKPPM
ncbi:MAG TPA: MFS transporter [Herpetosiphon sp.]|uniref:Major facilitator superfamily MFS_1 n=1 Tax=Herpetosiphon aurantiacus (strain ATCC 23779 / DSM 785 / 114-95) TaxID=316274 RepID=A9B280_HERA2|nr:MFS transporter [Herpetosiphon sp.]ABX07430.1 major facilitator superfamily MFS_1 [Herpetosiphon aurantiacus DSM 785]HBW51637.1 MFS transporter [Herpetosiphon sp.]